MPPNTILCCHIPASLILKIPLCEDCYYLVFGEGDILTLANLLPNNMGHSLEMFQTNAASNVQEKDESMNICSCETKHEHLYSLTNHGATICCVIYNLFSNYFKIYHKVPASDSLE